MSFRAPAYVSDGDFVWVYSHQRPKYQQLDAVGDEVLKRLGHPNVMVDVWRLGRVICAAGSTARVAYKRPDGSIRDEWYDLAVLGVDEETHAKQVEAQNEAIERIFDGGSGVELG